MNFAEVRQVLPGNSAHLWPCAAVVGAEEIEGWSYGTEPVAVQAALHNRLETPCSTFPSGLIAFAAIVVIALAIDLLAHRGERDHPRKPPSAGAEFVSLAIAFAGLVWYVPAPTPRSNTPLPGCWRRACRQPVRLRPDLRLLRRPQAVPAPGAVLRRDRRPGLPGDLHRRRGRDRLEVHRHPVRLPPSCCGARTS